MNPAEISGTVFFILVLGACLTIFIKKWWQASLVGLGAVVAAGVGMFYLAGHVFLQGPIEYGYSWGIAGFGAQLAFQVDYLSAVFVMLIGLLSVSSVVFAGGYLQAYRQESPGRYYLPFLLFITGMYGVVTAADFFYFLIFWEMMTLCSYFLVVFKKDNPASLTAGYVYFLVTHITSVGLIIAAVVLAGKSGSFLFSGLPEVFRELSSNLPLLHFLLAMFFIGFGAKAGVFPLGFWMPAAYAEAPASATALFSGVMSKMGVYGLLRVFAWYLPPSEITVIWGVIIATFGVFSMLVGNLRSMAENDAKRLLAQSSIGQMGYILLGVGLGLYFRISDPYLSMLAFIGALYHLLNHTFFKSLLFFNTGTVFYQTGTRDLNQVGGLVRVLPVACACGLIGSLAIAGIPPVNGFMSKWLLYQAAIFGGSKAPLFAFYGIIAIFISTVSLAAYLKYIATAYLGIIPEKYKEEAPGQPLSMKIIELMLAAGCILLGLFPQIPLRVFYRVMESSGPLNLLAPLEQVMGSMISSYIPFYILIALLVGILLSWGLYTLNKPAVKPVELWNCGEEVRPEAVRFRADSFYLTFTSHFAFLYRPFTWPNWQLPAALTSFFDLDRWLYFPLGQGFLQFGAKISRAHQGKPQLYLLWQLVGFGLFFLGLLWMMGV